MDALSVQFLLTLAGLMALAGGCAGLIAGLLGVGGGIVIVPVLFEVLPLLGVGDETRMKIAVATSLAVIVPTSIMSARTHLKKGAVDGALLRSLGPAIVLGVLAGSLFATVVSGEALTGVFAAIALLVALDMLLRPEGFTLAPAVPGGPARHGIGAGIGGFSVVMGIGGGTLSVPTFTLFGVPIHRAVATASVIGLLISVPGVLAFIASGLGKTALAQGYLGYVNLIGAAILAPCASFTAPYGARLAHRLSPRVLRLAFGLFLLATSVRLFSALIF